MILTQYCHQLGKKCDLKAAIAISAILDSHMSKESLEKPWINNFYTKFLAAHLCNLIKRYVQSSICHYMKLEIIVRVTGTWLIYKSSFQSILMSLTC